MRARTWMRPATASLASLALIAAFFLLREHWGHVLGYLPYILLLACPLMHLFHHGGHGHDHSTAGNGPSS